MRIWIPIAASSMLLVVLAFSTIFVFRRRWRAESKLRTYLQNTSLVVFSSLFSLLALEIIMGVFVVRSDGMNFTLSSQRWFQKYWHPMNSEGYRDYEHTWKRNILFVVGDSFIAGHGIEHIDDRLAGLLAKKLGSSWTVAVIAQNGWNSVDEYNALVSHREKPTVIVLSYFINDIENAAIACGLPRPQLIRMPNTILRPFINRSFILNWFYWCIYRDRSEMGNIYWDYIRKAYNNTRVWDMHKKELGNFIDYFSQTKSKSIVIVWPNLTDINNSMDLTSKVSEYFAKQQIEVIDLGRHFINRKPEDLVVNSMDPHPNSRTNKEVAELVFNSLFSKN